MAWYTCRMNPLRLEARQDRRELDADTVRAARAFLARIRGDFRVREALIFGSSARQSHDAGSDADIAIIMDGDKRERTRTALDFAGIAFDLLLDTGVLVEALPLYSDELDHPEQFPNPSLIRAIRRDGIAI